MKDTLLRLCGSFVLSSRYAANLPKKKDLNYFSGAELCLLLSHPTDSLQNEPLISKRQNKIRPTKYIFHTGNQNYYVRMVMALI